MKFLFLCANAGPSGCNSTALCCSGSSCFQMMLRWLVGVPNVDVLWVAEESTLLCVLPCVLPAKEWCNCCCCCCCPPDPNPPWFFQIMPCALLVWVGVDDFFIKELKDIAMCGGTGEKGGGRNSADACTQSQKGWCCNHHPTVCFTFCRCTARPHATHSTENHHNNTLLAHLVFEEHIGSCAGATATLENNQR